MLLHSSCGFTVTEHSERVNATLNLWALVPSPKTSYCPSAAAERFLEKYAMGFAHTRGCVVKPQSPPLTLKLQLPSQIDGRDLGGSYWRKSYLELGECLPGILGPSEFFCACLEKNQWVLFPYWHYCIPGVTRGGPKSSFPLIFLSVCKSSLVNMHPERSCSSAAGRNRSR